MPFIRTKIIKGHTYAYLVANQWRKTAAKRGSRQKVRQYLGAVHTFEQTDTPFKPHPEYPAPKDIIRHLLEWELSLCGFTKKDTVMAKNSISLDLSSFTLDCGGKGVIKLNEGYLCTHTLKTLVTFKLTGTRDEYRLARAFVDAGLRIPQELFVDYWQNLIK